MSSETTGRAKSNIEGPLLILIRGLPGTGKTYLSKALGDALGNEKVVLLDPDGIDKASAQYTELSKTLTEQGVDEIYHPNRFLKARAHEAIAAHKILIWNQPFSDVWGFERTVENLQNFASENNTSLPMLLIEVSASEEVAMQRITFRKQQGGHGPSEGRFARFVADYKSFAYNGYEILAVSGEGDVQDSVSKVLTTLRKLD